MSKAIVCAIVLAACATGGQSGGDTGDKLDAAVTRQDASSLTSPADAPLIRLDVGIVPLDAFVPPPPIDAASSVFCTADNQCTNSGECCVDLGGSQGFCGPGTVVFGECVPQ